MKISYLGPEGSYSWVVAEKISKKLNFSSLESYSDFKSIIRETGYDEDMLAVLSVENKISGLIDEVLEELDKHVVRLEIYDELTIPIIHCLLSKSRNINDCKKIYVHRQIEIQCSNYLETIPHLKQILTSSTSEAARLAALDKDACAIASVEAAEIYNLNILASNLGNDKSNWTKFIVLKKRTPYLKEEIYKKPLIEEKNKLEYLRRQIDEVDIFLLEYISKRLELVSKVGEYKKENNIPIIDSIREDEILSKKMIQAEKMNINPELIKDIWKRLIFESYEIEK